MNHKGIMFIERNQSQKNTLYVPVSMMFENDKTIVVSGCQGPGGWRQSIWLQQVVTESCVEGGGGDETVFYLQKGFHFKLLGLINKVFFQSKC